MCSELKVAKHKAVPLHIRYHVNSLVTYQDINAHNIPYENNFDIVIFNSISGAIGRHDNYKIQQNV